MRRLIGAVFVTALSMGATVYAAGPVKAQGLTLSESTKNRGSLFKSQVRLLDSRLSRQYESSARLKPKVPVVPDAPVRSYSGRYKGEYLEVAKAAARKHGIPENLFLRLVQQESGWNPGAVSPKGATGLAQLMPGTAQLLRVDILNPHENLEGGARYLKMMYSKFGTWQLALAAYNAGPGAVEKHAGIPPYAETKNYVQVIWGR